MYQKLSVEASWSAFTAFIQRIRISHGKQLRYISVLEFQKRGAIHFHVLIWGLPPTIIENERRTRYLQHQWLRGFCDIVPTDGSTKLSGYFAKYLSKQMHDPRLSGKKAYATSRNVLRPVQKKGTAWLEYAGYVIPVDKPPLQDRDFTTDWLGKANYKCYNIIDRYGSTDS